MGKSQRILAWSFLTTFFWFYPPVLTVLKIVVSTYALYTIEATFLCLSVYSVPASLLQPLMICAVVSACLHNLHLGSYTVWKIPCATALVLRACS